MRSFFASVTVFAFAGIAFGQGTLADYERASQVEKRFAGKVFRDRVEPNWFRDGDAFWYRNRLPNGGSEFVVVDAVKATRTVVREDALPKEAKQTAPRPRRIGRSDATASPMSPDGKWEAFAKENDVWLRNCESKIERRLSTDGKPNDRYDGKFFWSPDSLKLIAHRSTPGATRNVTLVESSPREQLQPKVSTYFYLKPGDEIPQSKPHLFDIATAKEIAVSDELFRNPWDVSFEHWSPDSSRFAFLYNQRGHGVVRVVAIDANTGTATALIDEPCQTFFDYTNKLVLRYLDKTDEIVWMSERSGWNHLYLIDAKTGTVKNAITTGKWVVRGVDSIDVEKREIRFRACGIVPKQDPYHVHHARVNFDGTGLTLLTEGDGTHELRDSPDSRFTLDTYSRIDRAPVTELRKTTDGSRLLTLETADISQLTKAGWRAPERFVAKGRDGTTDIHGIIIRPTNFDPKKTYPVIESIYAGPHDHHVPKKFAVTLGRQRIAELGFIVVQIDGMGTNWRSKAFHDVCWKNLGDGGFPDRIAWIHAAAAHDPTFDLSKGVGIYGGSAGGQNALRALLMHPEFYTVGVADCGCHDNRMDKIWWNEMWMSWPIGPHYAEQSNVVQAHKLQGKLLLTVGELDKNVDPSSTMQVANALVKANKDFDLIVVPSAGHGAGESPYAARRRMDFFVRHLHGVEPRK